MADTGRSCRLATRFASDWLNPHGEESVQENSSYRHTAFSTRGGWRRLFLFSAVLLTLLHPGDARSGSNAALLIGVSQYADINVADLKYADADARELASTLMELGGYEPNCVLTLTNGEATKSGIETAFDRISSLCSPGNVLNHVFVYFAGHAVLAKPGEGSLLKKRPGQEREFLAPHDVDVARTTVLPDGTQVNETFITKEWFAARLKRLKARHITVTIDACHSGVPDFENLIVRYFGFRKSIAGNAETYLAPDGRPIRNEYALLSASNEQDLATELDELRHGALSYAILRYMREFRRSLVSDLPVPIYVKDMYDNTVRFFRNETVPLLGGGRIPIIDLHEPQIFIFPRTKNDLIFTNINPNRSVRAGLFELTADHDSFQVLYEDQPVPEYKRGVFQLPLGQRSVVIYLPETNYRSVMPIAVREGAPQSVSLSLRGDLTVEIEDDEASGVRARTEGQVFLNGRSVGRTGTTISGILAGTYDMSVTYQGSTKLKTVSIRPESPLRIRYIVKRRAPPARPKKKIRRLPF